MSTVVRSLAAKVEVQTREAEANLDRFARKYRSAAPISGVALGANLHGGGLQFRGDSGFQSVMSNLSGGGAGLGSAVASGGLAGHFDSIRGFNALLKGGGAVVLARQFTASMERVNKSLDDFHRGLVTGNELFSEGVRAIPLLGDFTKAWDQAISGLGDALANNNSPDGWSRMGRWLFKGTRWDGQDIRNMDSMTAQIEADIRDRENELERRQRVAGGVGDVFSGDIARAEMETLAENADQLDRNAMSLSGATSAAERYNARLNELRFDLMAGKISQDAFNESMKAANDTYDEQSGVLDSIREQQQAIRDEWEDRRRAERETAALSKQTAMEEEDRLRRERRMEGVAIDASRIFVGRGAQGVGKQVVEDPQFKIANQLLRRIADNIGTARAA